MPVDISQELEIIDHEPKGRLVKDAIYQALNKLNIEANSRPTAKLGVPIDEVTIDTGWVTDWHVGEIIQGDVHKLDGKVVTSTIGTGDHYSARVNGVYVNHTGRAFVFAVVGDINATIENTDVSGVLNPTWEHVNTVQLDLGECMILPYGKLPSNAPIRLALDIDYTVRGYLDSASELPATGTEGDLYLIPEENSGTTYTNFYFYYNDAWVNGYETYYDDANIYLHGSVQMYLKVWSTPITEVGTLDVKVFSDTIGSLMSAGCVAVYDSSTYSYDVSTADYRVLAAIKAGIPDTKVRNVSDLPENASEGDTAYVYQQNDIYEYASGWSKTHQLQSRDAQRISLDYPYNPVDDHVGSSNLFGVSIQTVKIFVCIGTWGAEDSVNFLKNANPSEPGITSYTNGTVSPCTMSVWVQNGGLAYLPTSFEFDSSSEAYVKMDNELYTLSEEEGFYVVPIEIGPRERVTL